jgi:ribosome-binding protein aMBF1 (putative translation factor)
MRFRTICVVERHERIQAARKHAKLARRVFGNRFDPPISYETVRQWESGIAEPRPEKYDQIERITGIRASWLFSGTGPMMVGDDAPTVDDVMAVVRSMTERDRWELVRAISSIPTEQPDKPPKDRQR